MHSVYVDITEGVQTVAVQQYGIPCGSKFKGSGKFKFVVGNCRNFPFVLAIIGIFDQLVVQQEGLDGAGDGAGAIVACAGHLPGSV